MERRAPMGRKTPMPKGDARLAPGKPLDRRTPLPRTARLAQDRPLRSVPPRDTAEAKETAARARAPRKARDTGPTAAERVEVRVRDNGRCVRCGGPGSNDHHRVGRGMGGRAKSRRAETNAASRRLTLCGSGTTGCHGWVTANPAEAERLGYVVRRSAEQATATVPVLTFMGWRLYGDDPTLPPIPCQAPPEGDARRWRGAA